MRWIKSTWNWIDDRTGLSEMLGPVMTHLVPHDAKWWYVFGSATMCAFMIQVFTGAALAFSYIPSAAEAYPTLQFISHDATFGSLLRGMHYYGASAMVLMVGAHMAQVFLFGSYKFPREMNWATGVLLLGFTLVMGFTGQLLRWDQTAVWSVVVAAEQAGRIPLIGTAIAHFTLGGTSVGGATLSRFFAIHVFAMPALIFAFTGLHVILVLRNGISEPPKPGDPVDPKTYRANYHRLMEKTGRPFWPDAMWRDIVFCVAMITVIILLAWFVGPPELGRPPDPSIVAANPRPDWYLLWYFGVLALLPHGSERYFMVFAPVLVGVLLIIVPFVWNTGERSPRRRPWAVAAVIATALMIGSFWIAGQKSSWSPVFDARPLPESIVGASSGPIAIGGRLFFDKSCIFCHAVQGQGGHRGPDLSAVGLRLRSDQIILRISNGGNNMPAFAGNLTPVELNELTAFLLSRKYEAHRQMTPGEDRYFQPGN
ncbi:MAG TPA: cytochrome b N-terminal domain-containing protein [Opitutaceae bacterium]|jgi:ubiquinol-cytochrome c reductase cytochrome b subunit